MQKQLVVYVIILNGFKTSGSQQASCVRRKSSPAFLCSNEIASFVYNHTRLLLISGMLIILGSPTFFPLLYFTIEILCPYASYYISFAPCFMCSHVHN